MKKQIIMLLLAAAAVCKADTNTVNISTTTDKRIMSANSDPADNYALSVYNDGGGNVQRSIVSFDLSAIPLGAKIISATLELTDLVGSQDYGQTQIYRLTNNW